jgi:RNA polymerase sigma factor (sigma-70 family)
MTQSERDMAEAAMPMVYVVINSMGKSFPGIRRKLDSIDAVSVAYLAICRASQTYDPEKSKSRTYFSMAIRNGLLKELARSQRLRYDSPMRVPCSLVEKLNAQQSEAQSALRFALSVLPQEARLLVVSRYYKKLSIREIAEDRGLNQKTVRKRLIAAVTMLASLLGNADEQL